VLSAPNRIRSDLSSNFTRELCFKVTTKGFVSVKRALSISVCDEAILKATQLFVKYEHGLKLEDKLISQADYAKYFINLSVSCPNLKFKLVSDTKGFPLSEDMSSVVSLLSDGQL